MENVITISRPYANAIFQTALEEADKHAGLEFWNNVLAVADAALATEEGVNVLAKFGTYQQEIRKFIWACLPEELQSDKVDNFLHLLEHFNRFQYIPGILEFFTQLRHNYDLPVPVTIVTAKELNEEQIEQIGESVATKLDRKIQLDLEIDPTILSGIIIKAEEFTIDCSGKKNLETLKAILTK